MRIKSHEQTIGGQINKYHFRRTLLGFGSVDLHIGLDFSDFQLLDDSVDNKNNIKSIKTYYRK